MKGKIEKEYRGGTYGLGEMGGQFGGKGGRRGGQGRDGGQADPAGTGSFSAGMVSMKEISRDSGGGGGTF